MTFKLKNNTNLRIGKLRTRRGVINTPFFMPVGTIGVVKTLDSLELKKLGAQIMLSNTYHLYLRPGEKFIKKKFGSLHNFNKWQGPILTDSGGYQVFSLAGNKRHSTVIPAKAGIHDGLDPRFHGDDKKGDGGDKKESLVNIKSNGVEFKSHIDGSKHFFTPEKVIQIQLDLGSDIIMPLDVCPAAGASKNEKEKAVSLTIKWAERSKDYLKKQEVRIKNQERPLLFGIIQGGTDQKLREFCIKELSRLDFDGYAVGGLAVGEDKRKLWKVVGWMNKILPQNKPRYLMGVGTPNDIIKATSLGMDMFDCVLPTRLARHGVAYVKSKAQNSKSQTNPKFQIPKYKTMDFRKSRLKNDLGPIDKNCKCPVCRTNQESGIKNQEYHTRAYIYHLIKIKEILGIRLLTQHNLHTYLDLMKKLRQ